MHSLLETQLRRWLGCLLMVVLYGLQVQTVQAEPQQRVLFLAASPQQAGKYEKLKPLAEKSGLLLDYVMVDAANSQIDLAQVNSYDLLVIDAPYGAAISAMQPRIEPILQQIQIPWLWLRQDGNQFKGIAQELQATLSHYYSNGGPTNFSGFFCTAQAFLKQGSTENCPAVIVHPVAGIYHPQADEHIFSSLQEYLAWRKQPVTQEQPRIAVLFHKAYMDSGLTGFVDSTIARIEKAGALPIALYTSAMGNGELTALLSDDDQLQADALINMQIMLNAVGRKAEFEQLGIPVLQAMPYRKGEQADWEADQQGMNPQDIPFYLSQPEFAGLIDPIFAAATQTSSGEIVAIDRQLDSVVQKAMSLVRLQRLPHEQVRSAILFYNYPPGETNLGASFMNVPQSLEHLLKAYAERGYQVEQRTEEQLIDELSALLKPFYRTGQLQQLLTQNRAATLSLADYQTWFATLPERVRQPIVERWGEPQQAGLFVAEQDGGAFIIPRLQLGNQVILPQPPRSEWLQDNEKLLYHDTKLPPSHSYLATYAWLRNHFVADALIHFGTHGTSEWQPGKERGLDVLDFPYLVLGDVPVLYPYIIDNIGEALQTKRRGRAVNISHNTPAFGPAGLHGTLNDLHDLLHQWQDMVDGEVRLQTAERIRSLSTELNLDKDIAASGISAEQDFAALVDALHLQLHDLALENQPLGLARFGMPSESDLRLFTVQQMLGQPLLNELSPDDPEDLVAVDYHELKNTPVWQLLDRHVRQGEPWSDTGNLAELLEQGRQFWLKLSDNQEHPGFFTALQGRYLPAAYGGDPIRNPDSLPSGRNLYGFDPSRIPTQEAWQAGQVAVERLIEQHRELHGEYPTKLAFSLWSVETMRHYGLLEAQVLAAMGFKPQWDAGGRVIGIEPIAPEQLQRPRVDAVISVTGLYRDHFPQVMQWLALAAEQGSQLEEVDNPIAKHSLAVEQQLLKQGIDAESAQLSGRTRIFASESGAYSTGLDSATLVSDSFGETEQGPDRLAADEKLAQLYLERMQFAYGPDSSRWGEKLSVNLYAEQLRGTQGAVLSRSSNLYGMLTTDDPFQYLGGIGLAVRHLDGQTPQLYISNLRDAKNPKSETAAGFLARDLRSRYFHPGWIEAIQNEGYSGTLEVLGSINNFWGWQVTAPETVRDDQWDSFKSIYVDDSLDLDINEWFERHNPQAQAQLIERMLEAARKEYWAADEQSVQQLAERWQELAERYDIRSDNQAFKDYVEQAAGFGLNAPNAQPSDASAEPSAATEQVQGQKLERTQASTDDFVWLPLISLLLIGLAMFIGVFIQHRSLIKPCTLKDPLCNI